MGSKQDIIKLLLNHNLTEICFEILCHLDSKTFANCRQVNLTWRNYIDNYFCQIAKGKTWMDKKLYSNFMNPNFQPTIMKSPIEEEISILKADKFGIISLACSGNVLCYELYSLKLSWCTGLDICRFWNFFEFQTFPSEGSNLCLNNDRIFIVNRTGHLIVLDRSNGRKLFDMPNVNKSTEGLLLQVYENG